MPPHHVTRWSDDVFQFVAKKYNLKVAYIYHEKTQEAHKLWYLNTLIQNSLLNFKIIDISMTRKIMEKISFYISKILIKGLKTELMANGHTVLIVLEKESE